MKKKPIKFHFSDDYSDSSIKNITTLPATNNDKNKKSVANTPIKNQNNVVKNEFYNSEDEYIHGNNPFVLQDTSPFEISSDEYSEPTFQSQVQPKEQKKSMIERFYDQLSTVPVKKHTNYTYIFTYQKKETIKGPRFHYQLVLNEIPLFHTKTKLRHPKDPIRISSGTGCHFSQKEFEGFLKVSRKNHFFSLHQKTVNGPELMSIELTTGKGSIPKNVKVVIKNFQGSISNDDDDDDDEINANNSIIQDLTLINLPPQKVNSGHWTLNFDGKFAIPSVKNCILVKDGSEDQLITIRRISSASCEIDALDSFSPLCMFALGLSSFIGKI